MNEGKTTFIKDLETGQEVEAPFLVLALGQGRTSRGGVYLNVELADRSGRMQAKVWDNAEALAPQLAEGSVSLISGYVDNYRGARQFIIRQAWILAAEEIFWPDYLKAAARPMAEMKGELLALAESIVDPDFKRLVSAALSSPEVGDKFWLMPAAKSLHHAYLHGLLEHSLSVGRLAAKVAGHYPKLNGDLLIAGAILHDLGKVWEFSPPPKVDYTTIGRLKGHLTMGSEFLAGIAAGLPDFPREKIDLLQHLILSHHGEPEFGAPVKPQLLEALALHHLDNLDAKIEAIDSFIESDSDSDGWSGYHRLFGGYFRRTPNFPVDPASFEPQEPEQPWPPTEEESRPDGPARPEEPEDEDASDERLLF